MQARRLTFPAQTNSRRNSIAPLIEIFLILQRERGRTAVLLQLSARSCSAPMYTYIDPERTIYTYLHARDTRGLEKRRRRDTYIGVYPRRRWRAFEKKRKKNVATPAARAGQPHCTRARARRSRANAYFLLPNRAKKLPRSPRTSERASERATKTDGRINLCAKNKLSPGPPGFCPSSEVKCACLCVTCARDAAGCHNSFDFYDNTVRARASPIATDGLICTWATEFFEKFLAVVGRWSWCRLYGRRVIYLHWVGLMNGTLFREGLCYWQIM